MKHRADAGDETSAAPGPTTGRALVGWRRSSRSAKMRDMFKPTEAATPEEYIEAIDEPRRSDVRALHELIRETAPELEPRISSGMLAYGSYHYRYASGREGDWHPVALASQKRYISLYVIGTRDGGYLAETFSYRLPKADIGKSCVRFRRLADVDTDALRELIREGANTREITSA